LTAFAIRSPRLQTARVRILGGQTVRIVGNLLYSTPEGKKAITMPKESKQQVARHSEPIGDDHAQAR